MFKRTVFCVLSTLMLILVLTSSANASTSGLLAWWPLNEGSGNEVIDISSSGFNGTINNEQLGGLGSGGSAWYDDPERGMVLSFNGDDTSGAYVSFGDFMIPAMNMENGFTWAFWAKQQTGFGSNDVIIGNRYGGVSSPLQFIKFTPSEFEYYKSADVGTLNYDDLPLDTWVHMVIVKDGDTLIHYRDGESVLTSTVTDTIAENPFYLGGDAEGERWVGLLSDVYLYTRALTQEEILLLKEGLKPSLASQPGPEDGLKDVLREVILTWKAGESADKHNLYFGTNPEDVNTASTDSPLLIGPSLDVTSYDLGRLEFGQKYYWRVDEVNAPPDNTVFKGDLWSFTVEPYSIPIAAENITVTASSYVTGQEPENTINGSGLVDDEFHTTDTSGMWVTDGNESAPAWIQYDFDKVYKLNEMLVWNYNAVSFLSKLGMKDVTIEYTVDGTKWEQMESPTEFPQAPGKDGYACDIIVDFNNAPVKGVKITATSNRLPFYSQYGLSEVRLMTIPTSAREPSPEDGDIDVTIDSILGWRAGREADQHNVYISTDEQAVIDGSAPMVTVNQTSYDPPSLALSSTYFWKVDEVNDAESWTTWQGDIWSFLTQESLVVDDFESYNDIESGKEGSNLVYETWADGYNDSSNGSAIGYISGVPMETDIVHAGDQSVPILYDNTNAAISEVTVDPAKLPIGQNWANCSPELLVLWIHGDVGNSGNDRLYVKVGSSKFQYDGDISKPRWAPMIIDLTGVNLNNVSSLAIGIESSGGSGGEGVVFIDDILLYRLAPEVSSEVIWREAEDYDSIEAPMKLFSDPKASGGQYLAVESGNDSSDAPPESGGVARYIFDVQGGTYKISGRVIASWYYDDSFYVRIPDATIQTSTTGWVIWNYIEEGDEWHWDVVMDSVENYIDVEWTMAAGTHTLEIAYREDGVKLDAIVIEKID